MTHARSLAALLLCTLLSGPALAQDSTFDVEADDPAVEAELTEKERELADFFAERERTRTTARYTPEATALEEKRLLRRSEQEFGEFNDIDDDDLAQLDTLRADAPLGSRRVEKPGLLEKDFAIDCPAGTVAGLDGQSCVASVVILERDAD